MKPLRAFTLIELLVVIAIIGMLSSVILASLNSSRLRARDAAVRQIATQIRTLYAQQFADTGSYTQLKGNGDVSGWFGTSGGCSSGGFSGNYASEMVRLCQSYIATIGTCPSNTCAWLGNTSIAWAGSNPDTVYSSIFYLPGRSQQAGANRFLCVGSSGGVSEVDGAGLTQASGFSNNNDAYMWSESGCYANP
jgi:prepilin-type N-terminal cleavage/methylation domain-containing protein